MRFKSFKIGKSKEEPEKDAAETGESLTTQIVDLEEHVSDGTRKLEETEQELKELSDITVDDEDDAEAPPKPHGPLDELEVKPEDQLQNLDEETDVNIPPGEATEEVKVVEVGPEATAPSEVEQATASTEEDDSLNSLFSEEEDEENPLASLINALPDVTAQELVDDLEEIKGIIQEWHQK